MRKENVIAIFDVGKTNKKLFLFDENYRIVYDRSARFNEIVDDDGFPCENIEALRDSLIDSLREVVYMNGFCVKAVNFTAYGSALAYIGHSGEVTAPLYNYLKPYPAELLERFKQAYDGGNRLEFSAASAYLGNLNAGLQMYRLKYDRPDIYARTLLALHLPQFLSFVITGKPFSDITSIGCHTLLWDVQNNCYQKWVLKEQLINRLPLLVPSDQSLFVGGDFNFYAGVGLHDSSAALVPYLLNFKEPFVLISTGTWSITLNPFNQSPLTGEELKKNCLCYLNYNGIPVKASRLFSGHTYERMLNEIGSYFKINTFRYRSKKFDISIFKKLSINKNISDRNGELKKFNPRLLYLYNHPDEAYYHLIYDLARDQRQSSLLVFDEFGVKRLFVDGGFSENDIFMNMLSYFFHDAEVYAASMPQASALGAALLLHDTWNSKPIPGDLVKLRLYRCHSLFI